MKAGFYVFLGAVAVMVFLYAFPGKPRMAFPHQAPSGWTYPSECCAGSMDCQNIPRSAITITSEGYLVRLRAGMHRRYYKDEDHLFPFRVEAYNGSSEKNPNIKYSGDEEWHLCLGGGTPNEGGTPSDYIWRCLYIKPEGVI